MDSRCLRQLAWGGGQLSNAEGLRKKTMFAVGWTMLQTWGARLTSTAALVVLARHISPRGFGTIALATVIIELLATVQGQAVSSALIQRSTLNRRLISSVFWLNLALSAFFALLMLALAEPVAVFFHDQDLVSVMRVLSVVLVLTGLEGTPGALLIREMRFRAFAVRTVVAQLVASAVAIGLALNGAGVWALVVQAVVQAVVATTLVWIAARWWPRWEFDAGELRSLLSFASDISLLQIFNFLNRRVDDFLVGRYLGTRVLGLYSIAYRLYLTVSDATITVITSVALPVFSRLQHDLDRLRRSFLEVVETMWAVVIPIFGLTLILAPELVSVLFGARWHPAVNVVRILCLLGPIYGFSGLGGQILLSIGQSRSALLVNGVNTAATMVGFVIAVRFGLSAVALSLVVKSYVFSPLLITILRRRLGVQPGELASALARALLVCGPALAAAAAVDYAVSGHLGSGLTLLLVIAVGGAVYLLDLVLVAPAWLTKLPLPIPGRS